MKQSQFLNDHCNTKKYTKKISAGKNETVRIRKYFKQKRVKNRFFLFCTLMKHIFIHLTDNFVCSHDGKQFAKSKKAQIKELFSSSSIKLQVLIFWNILRVKSHITLLCIVHFITVTQCTVNK